MTRAYFTTLGLLAVILLPAAGIAATVRDVRIAFEREKDALFVREMITVLPDGDGEASVVIPLAEGARQPELAEESAAAGIALRGNALAIERRLPEEGLNVGVMFRLPVLDGVVAFEQSVGRPVELVHAALLLPDEGNRLKGDGFSEPEIHQSPEGLPVMFVVGRAASGHIRLLVTGLSGGPLRWLGIGLTILCFGGLFAGLLLWLRRKIAEPPTEG